ncbi:hypothetical protein C1701_23915 [Actinoalloteichus sp. AHMU CJ021]|nr:hypothetical protein C1701_23915 [Actinoalloteichus sp. AHMU CJ021]
MRAVPAPGTGATADHAPRGSRGAPGSRPGDRATTGANRGGRSERGTVGGLVPRGVRGPGEPDQDRDR